MKINQFGWEYLHSQVAENNLLADEKCHFKKGGGSYLYYRYVG